MKLLLLSLALFGCSSAYNLRDKRDVAESWPPVIESDTSVESYKREADKEDNYSCSCNTINYNEICEECRNGNCGPVANCNGKRDVKAIQKREEPCYACPNYGPCAEVPCATPEPPSCSWKKCDPGCDIKLCGPGKRDVSAVEKREAEEAYSYECKCRNGRCRECRNGSCRPVSSCNEKRDVSAVEKREADHDSHDCNECDNNGCRKVPCRGKRQSRCDGSRPCGTWCDKEGVCTWCPCWSGQGEMQPTPGKREIVEKREVSEEGEAEQPIIESNTSVDSYKREAGAETLRSRRCLCMSRNCNCPTRH